MLQFCLSTFSGINKLSVDFLAGLLDINQSPAKTIAHSPAEVKETLNYMLKEKGADDSNAKDNNFVGSTARKKVQTTAMPRTVISKTGVSSTNKQPTERTSKINAMTITSKKFA